MPKDFDIVVVGEINADLILLGDVTPAFGQVEQLVDDAILTIGSSSAIFACGAARLGLRVAFIGKVGEDQFGHFMIDALTARGIDVTGVVHDRALKTGLTVILSRGQDRAMLTYSGAIGALRYEEIDLALVRRARHLHLGSYYLLDALRPAAARLFAAAQAAGLSVSLDTNYDPTEQWAGQIDTTLAHVDIFLPNETELTAIARNSDWREALESMAQRVSIVAVKRGQEGAVARRGTEVATVAPRPLSAVDTTGAGDSFDAGFVYGYLAGWELFRTLQLATACGALSTQAAGGTAAQPTLVDALSFMEQLEH